MNKFWIVCVATPFARLFSQKRAYHLMKRKREDPPLGRFTFLAQKT